VPGHCFSLYPCFAIIYAKLFLKFVFTFYANPKYFIFHPSHRIFGCMHEALNVGKKDN
jgi:hypothetical protein